MTPIWFRVSDKFIVDLTTISSIVRKGSTLTFYDSPPESNKWQPILIESEGEAVTLMEEINKKLEGIKDESS